MPAIIEEIKTTINQETKMTANTFKVEGSWGTLTCDATTGDVVSYDPDALNRVCKYKVLDAATGKFVWISHSSKDWEPGEGYFDIIRLDVDEWRKTYPDRDLALGGDIIDFGEWKSDGSYVGPDLDWRKNRIEDAAEWENLKLAVAAVGVARGYPEPNEGWGEDKLGSALRAIKYGAGPSSAPDKYLLRDIAKEIAIIMRRDFPDYQFPGEKWISAEHDAAWAMMQSLLHKRDAKAENWQQEWKENWIKSIDICRAETLKDIERKAQHQNHNQEKSDVT